MNAIDTATLRSFSETGRLAQLSRISSMVLELPEGDRAAILALLGNPASPKASQDKGDKAKRGRKPKVEAATGLADYALPSPFHSKAPSARIVVHFADGESVRVPVPSLPKKPLNIGRALRVACTFWRARHKDGANELRVPEIARVECLDHGDWTCDGNDASRHTQTARTGTMPWQLGKMRRVTRCRSGFLAWSQVRP